MHHFSIAEEDDDDEDGDVGAKLEMEINDILGEINQNKKVSCFSYTDWELALLRFFSQTSKLQQFQKSRKSQSLYHKTSSNYFYNL